MEGENILREIINVIRQKDLIRAEDFGDFKEALSKNIILYKPNFEIINNIVAYYSNEQLVKIGFAGEKLSIGLLQMISLWGEYKLTYNFRDNYTEFAFNMVHHLSPKISRIICQRNNKIVYNPKDQIFLEITPKGEEKRYPEDEFSFNNFTIELAF